MEKRRKIKVKFVDFWPTFCENNNFIYNTLCKKYEVELSDAPDYLFYSCFGTEYLQFDCIRIFYTGENVRPDFNLCDYAMGFDFIQFEDRHLRYPHFLLQEYQQELELVKNRERVTVDALQKKSKFCNFIYSNSATHCPRAEFFEMLSKYKKVDSGGKYLNNIDYEVKDKLEWQKDYKFSIAFENATTNGYVTEKILQAFAAGTIPVYWGNPKVELDFNEKAFINCHRYNNFDEVVEVVKRLDQDNEQYLEMLNQPIFASETKESYLKETYLEDFLYHIVDQDIKKAKRITHEYIWSQRAEKTVRNSLAYHNLQRAYGKKNFILKAGIWLIMGREWRNREK